MLWKTCQDNQVPDQELNFGPPEYTATMLTIHLCPAISRSWTACCYWQMGTRLLFLWQYSQGLLNSSRAFCCRIYCCSTTQMWINIKAWSVVQIHSSVAVGYYNGNFILWLHFVYQITLLYADIYFHRLSGWLKWP